MFTIRFIENPKCPTHHVKHVLIGDNYIDEYSDFFDKNEIEPIPVMGNKKIMAQLEHHADMTVFFAGSNKFFTTRENKNILQETLENKIKLPVLIQDTENLETYYPNDCKLNVYYDGLHIITNQETASKRIVNYLSNRKGIKLINVKQGYSSCSICTVNENSIITGDPGIARNCKEAGMDVLLIDDNEIALEGFDHGFIGGCSFRLSENKIAFTGFIPSINIKSQIESFLIEKGYEAVYMKDEPIKDIGGIIPITIFT